jgi:hypothetical protein
VIKFHGGPITPERAAIAAWYRAEAMISFANPDQDELAFAIADQVALDNGAWPIFSAGKGAINEDAYLHWVNRWRRPPAFAWCLIPDQIDGTEQENDKLLCAWPLGPDISVPVWHMHESVHRLERLINRYPRVAIGCSGEYVQIGTQKWWGRIAEAMEVACDEDGHPFTKLHGLRQMDPEVFSVVPYSSVDSTNVARNIGIDSKWTGSYVPKNKETRAMILRENISNHASSERWPGAGGIPRNLQLYG